MPDAISLATTPVLRLDRGVALSRGSGFLFAHQSEPAGHIVSLVTNYHVVTGFAPRRNRPPVGDAVTFELRRAGFDPAQVLSITFPLRTVDGDPTWLRPPTFPDADLVVIPVPIPNGFFTEPPKCFDAAMVDNDVACYPGMPISVVGYPMGWMDSTNKVPVWKTGHIASEPDLDFDGDPKILVDITGRLGMSGSPVVAGHMGLYQRSDGMPRSGGSGKLLGVYASNAIHTQTQEQSEELSLEEAELEGRSGEVTRLELGFLWKSRLITETLTAVNFPDHRARIWGRLPPAYPPDPAAG